MTIVQICFSLTYSTWFRLCYLQQK